ncbi:MAG: phosphatase PAP2 family protein [Thermoanaerobacterales bacterium]|jgi:diacylglycerol kinase (ATP)|nr:phosphatase PAP2 family protein [Thermoanaerobacterales bacterium]
MKKTRSIIESFNYAISGIIYALKTQRNMRIHIITAVLILIASSFFSFSSVELLLILFAIALVIIAEMVNTAIESVVDLVTEKYHSLAKVAKNVAAGAVMIAAINAIGVGYILFYKKFDNLTKVFLIKARNSHEYILFVSIILIAFSVIVLKTKSGYGSPFSGGFPSGHSAIAFAILTALFFTSSSTTFILAFLLAILVLEARVEAGVHTVAEVIAGAALGAAITCLMFWIFT